MTRAARAAIRGWLGVSVGVSMALALAGCSQPTATVDPAQCFPDTDKSMGFTEPTQFLKLTMSADDRITADVRVVLFDASGKQIFEDDLHVGPVFKDDPNVKVIPLGTDRTVTAATASCTASVIG